jgi:hypothetical protein
LVKELLPDLVILIFTKLSGHCREIRHLFPDVRILSDHAQDREFLSMPFQQALKGICSKRTRTKSFLQL